MMMFKPAPGRKYNQKCCQVQDVLLNGNEFIGMKHVAENRAIAVSKKTCKKINSQQHAGNQEELVVTDFFQQFD